MSKIKTMTPKEIKRALDDVDISQAGLARDLDVSRSMVAMVIHNKAASHRVRCHIAKAIGLPVEEVFKVKRNPTRIGRPITHGLYDRERQAETA
jgi:transcriptional regulator with XRE-family HTH domain